MEVVVHFSRVKAETDFIRITFSFLFYLKRFVELEVMTFKIDKKKRRENRGNEYEMLSLDKKIY